MKRRCLKNALAGVLAVTLAAASIVPSSSAAAAESSTAESAVQTEVSAEESAAQTEASAEESAVQTEINDETVWSYYDAETDPAEGLANRTDWTLDSYDVSAWKQATGSFGAKKGAIADLGSGYIPTTLVNQYKEDGTDIEAFFFRTNVTVADVSAITMMTGNVYYDDSATVYINGVKVIGFDDDSITENMQYGGTNGGTPYTGVIKITDAEVIQSVLKEGENIVAVEVHQGRAASSDLYFDMDLTFSTEPLPEPGCTPTNVVLNVGSDEKEASVTWYTTWEEACTLELTAGDNTSTYIAEAYATTTSDENGFAYYKNTVGLTGLTAGTTYTYRVSGGEQDGETIWSGTYDFTPKAVGANNSFSFMAVGDPQIGCSNVSSDTTGWVTTMNTALTQNPDLSFLLSLGDQINNTSAGSQLVSEYNGFLDEEAQLTSLPLATILGNHDNGFAKAYTEHYAVPNLSTYGSSNADVTGDEDYYFTYNGVLFLILNSNNSSAAEHEAFMRNAIAACPDAKWKVVAYHHSVYSVASHAVDSQILTLRERLAPIFTALDIDVVFQGHDHVYVRSWIMGGESGQTVMDTDTTAAPAEYTDPDGVMYVTLNSASGSKYYNIKSTVYEYSAVQNQEYTPNYSIVKVDDESFTITTYRTADESVVDTVTIYKKEVEEQPEVTPVQVTGVEATCVDGKVVVTWDDCGAAQYKVMRTDCRTGYTTLTYSATAEGFVDSDVVVSELYYYRVCGYFYDENNDLVQGDVSEAAGVVATTDAVPGKVENVAATVEDGTVVLTWDQADNARYYKVSRAAGTTGSYYTQKYNIAETTYTDTTAEAGLHRYKVVAYYKNVNGDWVYGDLSDTLYVTVE